MNCDNVCDHVASSEPRHGQATGIGAVMLTTNEYEIPHADKQE